jgi:hypothetical protein
MTVKFLRMTMKNILKNTMKMMISEREKSTKIHQKISILKKRLKLKDLLKVKQNTITIHSLKRREAGMVTVRTTITRGTIMIQEETIRRRIGWTEGTTILRRSLRSS